MKKKSYYFFIFLLIVFTSCSKDDNNENTDKPRTSLNIEVIYNYEAGLILCDTSGKEVGIAPIKAKVICKKSENIYDTIQSNLIFNEDGSQIITYSPDTKTNGFFKVIQTTITTSNPFDAEMIIQFDSVRTEDLKEYRKVKFINNYSLVGRGDKIDNIYQYFEYTGINGSPITVSGTSTQELVDKINNSLFRGGKTKILTRKMSLKDDN